MAAILGGALLSAGCAQAVTATDGAVFRQSGRTPDALSSALAASASHDLPCSGADLEVAWLGAERSYAVSGCGERVVYRVLTPAPTRSRLQLVSRAALLPGDEPRTPQGEQASARAPSPVGMR